MLAVEFELVRLQENLDRLDAVTRKLDYELLHPKRFDYYEHRNRLINSHKLIYRSQDAKFEIWVPVEVPQKDE